MPQNPTSSSNSKCTNKILYKNRVMGYDIMIMMRISILLDSFYDQHIPIVCLDALSNAGINS